MAYFLMNKLFDFPTPVKAIYNIIEAINKYFPNQRRNGQVSDLVLNL